MYVLGFIVFITTKKLVFGNNYIYIRNKKFLHNVIFVAIFLLPIIYSGCRIFNRTATGGGIIFFFCPCAMIFLVVNIILRKNILVANIMQLSQKTNFLVVHVSVNRHGYQIPEI